MSSRVFATGFIMALQLLTPSTIAASNRLSGATKEVTLAPSRLERIGRLGFIPRTHWHQKRLNEGFDICPSL